MCWYVVCGCLTWQTSKEELTKECESLRVAAERKAGELESTLTQTEQDRKDLEDRHVAQNEQQQTEIQDLTFALEQARKKLEQEKQKKAPPPLQAVETSEIAVVEELQREQQKTKEMAKVNAVLSAAKSALEEQAKAAEDTHAALEAKWQALSKAHAAAVADAKEQAGLAPQLIADTDDIIKAAKDKHAVLDAKWQALSKEHAAAAADAKVGKDEQARLASQLAAERAKVKAVEDKHAALEAKLQALAKEQSQGASGTRADGDKVAALTSQLAAEQRKSKASAAEHGAAVKKAESKNATVSAALEQLKQEAATLRTTAATEKHRAGTLAASQKETVRYSACAAARVWHHAAPAAWCCVPWCYAVRRLLCVCTAPHALSA